MNVMNNFQQFFMLSDVRFVFFYHNFCVKPYVPATWELLQLANSKLNKIDEIK